MAAGGLQASFARLGLSLRLREGGRSALIAAGSGLAFGMYMVVGDATVFHLAVPDVQQIVAREWPLSIRIVHFLRGALIDEVVLRLAGLSAVLWLAVGAIGRRTPVADGLAILITAAVLWPLSAWGYLTALDGSLLTVLRELCLHVAAGVLWGWLYCRHGWLAGLIGHVSAHLVLQPALPLLV